MVTIASRTESDSIGKRLVKQARIDAGYTVAVLAFSLITRIFGKANSLAIFKKLLALLNPRRVVAAL